LEGVPHREFKRKKPTPPKMHLTEDKKEAESFIGATEIKKREDKASEACEKTDNAEINLFKKTHVLAVKTECQREP